MIVASYHLKSMSQGGTVADPIALVVESRDTLGKKVGRLRRDGTIPVHLYGPGTNPRSLQCQGAELAKAVSRAGGSTPITITVSGEKGQHLVFVREVQRHPVRGNLLHVDFLRTEATQMVSAEVPVTLVGDSPGARSVSGTVVLQLHVIRVEALPLDMPREISIDISSLTEPNGVIRCGEIALPSDSTLLSDPEDVVVRIEIPKATVEEEGLKPEAEGAQQMGSPEEG